MRLDFYMECKTTTPRLEVEVGDTVYGIEFGQVQIEITGNCNMNCQHCRASKQLKKDMPVEQIIKIMNFARQFSPNYKEVIVSGGEPLLHKEFSKVLTELRKNGAEYITLTTNGSLLRQENLDLIKSLNFERVQLSVSLDSLKPKEHDSFRNSIGAYDKAVNAIKLIAKNNDPKIVASMRCTLRPSQINDMEEMAGFARKLGCKRVSFSAIHPAGRAIERPDLWMNSEQKRFFIEEVYRLKKVFPDMNITTNDPLKCIIREKSDIGKDGEIVFDGCGAGAITFNVNSNGTMTPCALLDIPMMNVFELTIQDITKRYKEHPIVKDMLSMNLRGRCANCSKKYQCGGCRARALIQNKDFMGEDPHCWL